MNSNNKMGFSEQDYQLLKEHQADADKMTKAIDTLSEEVDAKLDNKVSKVKVSQGTRVYASQPNGDLMITIASSPFAWTMLQYNGSGYISVKDPTADAHPATKKYVDDLVAGSGSTKTTATMTTNTIYFYNQETAAWTAKTLTSPIQVNFKKQNNVIHVRFGFEYGAEFISPMSDNFLIPIDLNTEAELTSGEAGEFDGFGRALLSKGPNVYGGESTGVYRLDVDMVDYYTPVADIFLGNDVTGYILMSSKDIQHSEEDYGKPITVKIDIYLG